MTATGLACPHCGCRRLRVYYTRPRNAHILRVRRCVDCDRRMVTRETLAGGSGERRAESGVPERKVPDLELPPENPRRHRRNAA